MDLKQAFLLRYNPIIEYHFTYFYNELTEQQLRSRPSEAVNPILWCLWHVARTEDIGINRMATDGRQVFDDGGWQEKLHLNFRHFGIGMTAAEVTSLSETLDIQTLKQYHQAVGERTLDVSTLDAIVTDEHVTQVLTAEGAVKPERLKSAFDAYQGNSKGWFLMHMCLTHTYIHIGEMNTIASLMGINRI
jgi:hypothetical protein